MASRLLLLATLVTVAFNSKAQLFKFHHIVESTISTGNTKSVKNDFGRNQQQAQSAPVQVHNDQLTFYYIYTGKVDSLKTPKPPRIDFYQRTNVVIKQGSDGVPVVEVLPLNPAQEDGARIGDDKFVNSELDLSNHKIILDLSREKVKDPYEVAKIPFRAFLLSFNTVPLRLRVHSRVDSLPSTATGSVSFAVNYGYVWGKSRFSPRGVTHSGIALSPFFGVTTVSLSKSTFMEPSKYRYDQTNLGLSGGLSITILRNNSGFVIAGGLDHCVGKNSNQWIYQNQPWIGFGISTGLGFF